MNGYRLTVLAIASISCAWFGAAPARAASLQKLDKSLWTGGATLPSYVEMYVYAPDKVVAKPAIVVSAHSCGGSASVQIGNIGKFKDATDKTGDMILIFPDNPGRSCWDVGSPKSLTHDGGGDTHAVAQMVRYALNKYGGDPKRVYVNGGSSGGMMTQALLGVYPEMFIAGASRAGVPCGCWAQSYDDSGQWSGPCAGGSVTKTAQQWGDLVRAINPNYTGHRPRVQLYHGDSDGTISYKNMGEAIKEWTNVLGLATTPSSTDTIQSSGYTYNRQFWKNACGFTVLEAWTAPGKDHSMTYEQDAMMKFFGLDVVGGPDPELAACGGGGDAGVGGAGGTGGTTGAGGASGGRDGGPGGRDGAGDVASPGGGGSSGSGGAAATGGTSGGGTGGRSGSGGTVGTGGSTVAGTGGKTGSGGSAVGDGGRSGSGGLTAGTGGSGVGGSSGSSGQSSEGGTSGRGGSSGTNGGAAGAGDTSSGCSCRLESSVGPSTAETALLLAVFGLLLRRRRLP